MSELSSQQLALSLGVIASLSREFQHPKVNQIFVGGKGNRRLTEEDNVNRTEKKGSPYI